MNYLNLKWLLIWIFSFLLTLLPLPALIVNMMPNWVFLLLLYRVMIIKSMTESIWILVTGLMLDVMQWHLLGEHVFALALSLWMAKLKLNRFYTLTIHQQLIWVVMSVAWYYFALIIVHVVLHETIEPTQWISMLFHIILTTLCWPWVSMWLNLWVQGNMFKYHRFIEE